MSAIHIILHGLIALAPVNDANGLANHMTALLVDARQEPPGVKLECFAPHVPTLMVQTQTSAECIDAHCVPAGVADCVCRLARQEISLQPDFQAELQKLNKAPESGLPFENRGADDFSYVANLSQPPLHRELDERFLASVPPPALIARMKFPFESISACSLGTRRDEGSNNVHPMAFRPIHKTEKVGEASQALAQQVVATFETDESPVTITISDFGGGTPHKLVLKPIGGEYNIRLMNMRTPQSGPNDLAPDDPCDDGVGRDFAFFYELVTNPPAWSDRPLPHVKYTRWKSEKDLEISICTKTKTVDSHPICAMASFNR